MKQTEIFVSSHSLNFLLWRLAISSLFFLLNEYQSVTNLLVKSIVYNPVYMNESHEITDIIKHMEFFAFFALL